MMTEDQIAEALIDPASIFSNPMAVVAEDSLSTYRKIDILKRWEYDAREIQVGDEEGFPAREPGTLFDAVLIALHRLDAGPDLEHSPPTKQGGA